VPDVARWAADQADRLALVLAAAVVVDPDAPVAVVVEAADAVVVDDAGT